MEPDLHNIGATRILVIEDNPGDARLIAECFRESGDPFVTELKNVKTLKEALETLDAGQADFVMLDLSLPDSNGLDTFRAIQEKAPKLPIVVLSGNENEELAAEIVKMGAQDSLSKDFLGMELSAALIRRTVRHAIERKHAHESLKSIQMQLIQAEKLESIGRLAAGVAHEVRNPLARVKLGLDYLQAGIDPNDKNLPMVIERMTSAIAKADTILRGMLDFSSDRGLLLTLVDTNTLLANSILLVEHEIKSRKVTIRRDLASDLPPVSIDSGKIEQVIINLMLNAVHAMEESEQRTLTIKTSREVINDIGTDPGSRTRKRLRDGDEVVTIRIEDTGGGIAKEDLARIWDPFFTTKPTGKGTGLGLSVVRKIIDLHFGFINLENIDSGVAATIKLKTS
jgi:signal transduction histidine kinase